MTAVILAGGMGTRLSEYTQTTPKPLLKVKGKPILEHQITVLKKNGFSKVLLVIGYLGEQIRDYFGNGSKWGVGISYFEETTPLGTAGGLIQLKEVLPDEFLIVYGDLIFDVDITRLIAFHRKQNADATLMVHPNDHPADSDILVLDDEGRANAILRKNTPRPFDYNNCVNAGIFYCNKRLFSDLASKEKQDLEKDVIEPSLLTRRIFGYKTTEYLRDMGTLERFSRVKEDMDRGVVEKRSLAFPQKAVFLDRDGTLNKHIGLLYKPEQLAILDGVYEALAKINRSEYLSIVITNQSVVARNLCTLSELGGIHRRLETLLGMQNVYIDDLFFCPHHPDAGYPEENKRFKFDCQCRKPKTGLIEAAAKKYNIDLSSSYFIGDSSTDIEAGKRGNLRTILLYPDRSPCKVKPDHYAQNLLEAINIFFTNQMESYASLNA